jgi:hypothetical protein
MIKGLDVRKAEAALERAARKAVHGSREDRSGRVISSALTNVSYDPKSGVLEVRFVTGRVYQYLNVPEDVFEKLMRAESKGIFFNAHIRGHYRYHELTRRNRR